MAERERSANSARSSEPRAGVAAERDRRDERSAPQEKGHELQAPFRVEPREGRARGEGGLSRAPVDEGAAGEGDPWEGPFGSTRENRMVVKPADAAPVAAWVTARFDLLVARLLDLGASRRQMAEGEGEPVALARTGGPIARWVSFPRGVRTVTAATSAAAVGLGAWGLLALAGSDFGLGLTAAAAASSLATASGPIGVRMANRLHGLVARRRRYRISELRGLADRRAVAVRGVVLARRTSASALDGRPVVWSLTRFRRGRLSLAGAFFHELAHDFLIDDGTDEPIWIEVAGGMLIDPFPRDRRVQFQSTTLLDIDHPFLTGLRLRDREVRAAEIAVAAGDVVEVVGRLSRRLDPTAPSDSRRQPPQRRALRSGTRVPVMVRRVLEPDLELARVRRLVPRGAPDGSPGEPPVRKF